MGSTGRGRCAEFGGCGYFESLRLCACPPDLILGGNGNDAVVGGRWNDTALLGSGDDAFGWDPGDGNDTVEGEAGFDRLVFDGANLNENIDISANGSRVRLFRDVAVLRFQPDGLPAAPTADAASLHPGHVVLAIGNHEGAPIASLGIVAIAGPAWHSLRGGTIDSLIRLDLALSPAAEGGAVIDVQGRVVGMAVLGPRRRVLAIPTSTIDRVVDQLLAKGHVFRGYLGAGLQPVRLGRRPNGAQSSGSGRGILVTSIDPDGPAARAGLLVGDVVTTWNAKPVDRVREVMRLLGSDSIGNAVDLGLLRGGAPTTLKVVIGERPVA
jgi:S1-C subfamily serine protease